MADTNIQIDLAEVTKEVSALTDEQMRDELLKFRVRQKKQQKKNQGSETQKKYQAKQREKMKLLKQRAIDMGIWDTINEQAEAKAEEELASETVADEAGSAA